jgi:hypothetical protein
MQKTLSLLAILGLLAGCGESAKVRLDLEARQAERLAAIEVEKAKQLAKLQREQRAEEQRRINAERMAVASRVQDGKLKLVKDLTFSTRESILDESDKVLQIRNQHPQSIDVYLKCYTVTGRSKTIFLSVPALQTTEVGILEGWPFRPGEKFEVIYNDEVVHRYVIN